MDRVEIYGLLQATRQKVLVAQQIPHILSADFQQINDAKTRQYEHPS